MTSDNTGTQLRWQPRASGRRTSLQTTARIDDNLLISIVRNDFCISKRGLAKSVRVLCLTIQVGCQTANSWAVLLY